MFSRVLCGRFYKIFVSPMLHEVEDSWSRSDWLFLVSGGDKAGFGDVRYRKRPGWPKANSCLLLRKETAGGKGMPPSGGIPIPPRVASLRNYF